MGKIIIKLDTVGGSMEINMSMLTITIVAIVFVIIVGIMIAMTRDVYGCVKPYKNSYKTHMESSFQTKNGYYVKKANFKTFKKELCKALPLDKSIECYNYYSNQYAIIDKNKKLFVFNDVVMIFNFKNFKKVYKYLENIDLGKPFLEYKGKWDDYQC